MKTQRSQWDVNLADKPTDYDAATPLSSKCRLFRSLKRDHYLLVAVIAVDHQSTVPPDTLSMKAASDKTALHYVPG